MITIENGGVEEIIPADQANKKYIVEVAGAPVRIGHTNRYAKDGAKLEPGRNHKVDNLRGERLFAAAVDGEAQLLINQAAADVDSQPGRDVLIEGDVIVSDGATASNQEIAIDNQQEIISLLEQIEENTGAE